MNPLNWREPLLLASLRRLHPLAYRELMLLRHLDQAPAAEICELHERRLRALLHHAYEQTDYYREVLSDCGVIRNGKVDLGRFEELPILTKELIRAEGPRLRARELPPGRKAYVNRTGGSTGQPVEYWQDSHYWDVNVATKLYHFEVLGKRPGEPELKVWGSDRDIVLETGSLKRRAQNWLYNRRIRTCGRLGEDDVAGIIREINAFRPKSVWGYIDGLYTVAEYANHTGRQLHPPAAVFGGGGTLLPPMVQSIRQAFGAPVVNFYGSREMGDVACECAQTAGLHIASHSHKVEVLDSSGRSLADEDGDIVLTSLHNYAMPLIRYRIGDRGRLTRRTCSCGRGFPLLEDVSGRGMEAFVRADGTIVSPIYLITAVGTLIEPGLIDRLQFVQEDYARVVVKTVIAAGAAEEALHKHQDRIRGKLRDIMGQACEVAFERPAEIHPTASGKYLYTVSHVRPPTPGLALFNA